MAWVYLAVAGLLEIGWPLGLKIAETPESRIRSVITAVLFMAASGALLWLAQRDIPMGTAYRLDRHWHCRDTDCGDSPVR
jgi:quaternary ammonium compound-resistance protein SugE